MKTLSREAILRMVGNGTSYSGGSSGGVGVDLSGYATEKWVDENYLSIEFFGRLFKAYNGGTEVLPNDAQSTIDNIRAMFGFWTESYLSALGQNSSGGGGGGGTPLLEPLASINEAGLAAHPSASGQTIIWNGTAWVYGSAAGGGGSVTSIATGTGLTGGPITTNGTISIDSTYQGYISHGESAYQWMQSNPLSGYATQSWVNGLGFITQSNADNRYLRLTGGSLTGNLTMKGMNLVLGTAGTSSDDSGDIQFNYGGGYEKARIWVDNTPSTLQGPNYRVYDSSGTLLGTTRLALLTDNVGSATKLQTARTIWGQSFDGTANVSGGIDNASYIEFSQIAANAGHGGYIDFHYNGSTADYTSRIIEMASGKLNINSTLYAIAGGNVGVGTDSPAYKLDVSGAIHSTTGFRLDNNTNIQWKDSGGTYRTVMILNSGNTFAIGYNIRTAGYTTDIQGGNITFAVNNSSRTEAMEIDSAGRVYVKQGTQGLRIGDGLLTWDSTNNALKVQRISGGSVVAGNFYATGGVSALGFSSIGSSPSFDSVTAAEKVTSPKFYLDASRYIYLDNGTLKYYNGTSSQTIALT